MTTTGDDGAVPVSGVVLAGSKRTGRGRRKGRRQGSGSHVHSAGYAASTAGVAHLAGPAGPTSGPSSDPGRSGRRRWPWGVVAAVLLLTATGSWLAAHRISSPLGRPVPHVVSTAMVVVPGTPPSLPWPAKGQGAIAVPSIRYSAQSGAEAPVPIASLTKMTTAVVVLRDHPLPPGSDGPVITVTAADAAEYQTELHNDESSVAIQTGESLTERQMLEGLLTQSANDIAYSLAAWDAGSVSTFVGRMNALANSLGATDTHYVDASGYDPKSVSSASDVLRVASAGMAIPAFAQIVALTTVDLPLVGTLHNIVSEVGTDGVVGIKSGYTSEAGACMVLAANRMIEGRSVLVLVAVLGQPTPPPTLPKSTTATTTTTTTTTGPAAPAAPATTGPPSPTTTTTIPLNDLPIADPFKFARPPTDALLAATQAAVTPVTVATAGQVVGSVVSIWGGRPHPALVVMASTARLPGWPGQTVASMTRLATIAPGSRAGAPLPAVRAPLSWKKGGASAESLRRRAPSGQ